MKTLFFAAFCSALFFLAACGGGSQNGLRSYYFPIDSLREGLVYEYTNTKVGALAHYRHFQADPSKSLLTGTFYNGLFLPDMAITEREVSNGMVCDSYNFFVRDSLGKEQHYTAKIEENVLFPFQLTKDSSADYRFRMQFALPPDLDMKINFVRNRHFERFSEFTFQGKKIPAVVFESAEDYTLADTTKGGFWKKHFDITEIYAKGIGLVHYEKKSETDSLLEMYQLTNRYSSEQFAKMKTH